MSLKARVNETTTTTGTSNLTLAGAKTGFQSFNTAFGTSVSFYYMIEAVDGSNLPTGDWEYGIGHLSGSTTLVRDLVLGSSNSGSAVNLSAGTKNVFCPGQSLSSVGQVGGRLTLTSAVPILTSTVSGATTVYYTPYKGNQIPLTLDGVNFFFTTFSELSQATTDATKSPAAVGASSVYDMFVWYDAGTIRCTRGPAWSSDTSRGTGAGTTELQVVAGYYTNKNAITNGPGANLGTYVGSIRSNGSSTIDFGLGGSASGGTAGLLYVWNYFNRVTARAISTDTAASYNYTTATIREANNNTGNQINFLSGLAEDAISGTVTYAMQTVAIPGAFGITGISMDSTTAIANNTYFLADTVASAALLARGTVAAVFAPALGVHYICRVEDGDGSHANTFNAISGDNVAIAFLM